MPIESIGERPTRQAQPIISQPGAEELMQNTPQKQNTFSNKTGEEAAQRSTNPKKNLKEIIKAYRREINKKTIEQAKNEIIEQAKNEIASKNLTSGKQTQFPVVSPEITNEELKKSTISAKNTIQNLGDVKISGLKKLWQDMWIEKDFKQELKSLRQYKKDSIYQYKQKAVNSLKSLSPMMQPPQSLTRQGTPRQKGIQSQLQSPFPARSPTNVRPIWKK